MTDESNPKFTTKRRSIGLDGELKWGGDDGEPWSEAVESSEGITLTDDGTITSGSEIPDNVVARWPHSEDQGSTLYDTIGSLNGIINGPSWISDNIFIDGNHLFYNGSNDDTIVSVSSGDPVILGGPRTIAVTLSFEDYNNSYYPIQKGESSSYGNSDYSVNYTSSSGGFFGLSIYSDNDTLDFPSIQNATDKLPPSGEPFRYVATWDGTTNAGGAKNYLNGNLESSGSTNGTDARTTTDDLYLGRQGDDANTKFWHHGIMDDLIIANGVWDESTIQNDYNRQPWS